MDSFYFKHEEKEEGKRCSFVHEEGHTVQNYASKSSYQALEGMEKSWKTCPVSETGTVNVRRRTVKYCRKFPHTPSMMRGYFWLSTE